jgi:iron complex transport system ATP-binding protein
VLDHGRVAAAGPPATILTADLVRAVYEVDALIDEDPTTAMVRITYQTASAPVTRTNRLKTTG